MSSAAASRSERTSRSSSFGTGLLKGFYLAIGAQKSAKLNIPGEELEGVFGGVEFLREVNLGNKPAIGKRCAVIGGGNVAMDVCRSAVRLGAEETYIIYRRSQGEMPADPEEVKEAMEEGVKFRFLSAPIEIIGHDGKVSALKVEAMELGEPDEKGRHRPIGTGKFETIELDSVIGAIGQTVDWGGLDVGRLVTTKKGTAEADALTYQTAQPDIFVGGDCYTGPSFAINAIAAGKEAAISLHRYVHPGQTLTAGRDRREYRALDKEHVMLDVASFDNDRRQRAGYNAAKAKTFADARVTFTGGAGTQGVRPLPRLRRDKGRQLSLHRLRPVHQCKFKRRSEDCATGTQARTETMPIQGRRGCRQARATLKKGGLSK